MYKIPLFKLNYSDEESAAVNDTLKSGWISTGSRCREFEDEFKKNLNIGYALTTANCTTALHLAMRVLNIRQEDEVIVPSLTFVATVNAVRYAGAKPVFADIESIKNLNISPDDISKKISKKTKAIIVMHYGGFPCKMNEILKIAAENDIKVIEDASHSPLSEFEGKKLGTFGDISTFSFFSNKNISTGEGGMFVTDNAEYYEKAKLLRSHGMTTMSYDRARGHATNYDVVELGYNYRMDDIRGALGLIQLKKLKNDLIKREQIRKEYIKYLSPFNDITIPFLENNYFVSNYIFPIVLNDNSNIAREELRNELHKNGIQTSVHYPAIHKFSIYQNDSGIELPKTEFVADNEITLPMYSSLSHEDIAFISDTIQKILIQNQ